MTNSPLQDADISVLTLPREDPPPPPAEDGQGSHGRSECWPSVSALPHSIGLVQCPHAGTVELIVPTADRSKGTVLAKVRFNDRDDRVLPEISAKVSFAPAGQAKTSANRGSPSTSLHWYNGKTEPSSTCWKMRPRKKCSAFNSGYALKRRPKKPLSACQSYKDQKQRRPVFYLSIGTGRRLRTQLLARLCSESGEDWEYRSPHRVD